MPGEPSILDLSFCPPPDGSLTMIHRGLPSGWAFIVVVGVFVLCTLTLMQKKSTSPKNHFFYLLRIPIFGPLVARLTASPWPLVGLRGITVFFLLLVIATGLWGTPFPERNFATTLTWTFWWTLVIISVFFIGTAWCAICPWDAIGVWLTRRKLWGRGAEEDGFNLRLPQFLRSVWPALLMLTGLTWLELGFGVTVHPASTAILALIMVVLTMVSLALFERKSFCRYLCPVGRTLGFYAQLAPLELRPLDQERCQICTTLECYHGSQTIEPCPTFLTMGRFGQNTYCLSCGSCVLSCPHANISWRLRPMAAEAKSGARPHPDEAWFMVVLLALTTFHGITMMPMWEDFLRATAPYLKDSGKLLLSFSLGMSIIIGGTVALYLLTVAWSRWWSGVAWLRLFTGFSFATLPVAFAYHLAHNLNHLLREGSGFTEVLLNPFGTNVLPMTPLLRHMRMKEMWIPESWVFALQAMLLLWGFWMATEIVQHRLEGIQGWKRLPMLIFLAGFTGLNLWIVMQDMVMRL
ncbi:MAG: 4Fe-4S binding protein [Magnetococcus sp. DMHC-6]